MVNASISAYISFVLLWYQYLFKIAYLFNLFCNTPEYHLNIKESIDSELWFISNGVWCNQTALIYTLLVQRQRTARIKAAHVIYSNFDIVSHVVLQTIEHRSLLILKDLTGWIRRTAVFNIENLWLQQYTTNNCKPWLGYDTKAWHASKTRSNYPVEIRIKFNDEVSENNILIVMY